MKSNVDEVLNGLKEVKEAIEKLFYITNNNQAYCMNLDELIEYEDSPDGRMYRDKFRNILVRLYDIQKDIDYLERSIAEIGCLRKNDRGYFEMVDEKGHILYEFHCGYRIEALIYDAFTDCEKWVVSRVKRAKGKYYIMGFRMLEMDGLKVRTRSTVYDII